MLRSGRNLATLMSRYGRGVDWSQEEHWSCNDNVHPSRYVFFFFEKKKFPKKTQKISKLQNFKNSHATYDGIDMHPFETIFVKSSWHVGEPFVSVYSRWAAKLASSSSGSPSSSEDLDGENGDENDDETTSSSFDAGTKGQFDEPRYRYAISPEAQDDWGVSSCFGKAAPPLPEWRRREQEEKDESGWKNWWRT